jgi:hypothetical protein
VGETRVDLQHLLEDLRDRAQGRPFDRAQGRRAPKV